ncbi:MAG: type III-B CRISPR module-associated Cmr3 family protein [Mastigocoleus sp. MO_167.B18]|nr:type III-B CRISPR module-associated Cmr3 family protein [Mastigocoleus sp. MO_167.B18]
MFKYIISISPLGYMYGSSGAFLSPENLVGRSGRKFPPEAATLSGLIFSTTKSQHQSSAREVREKLQAELRENLYVTGPFWAEVDDKQDFYVPIPWSKIISRKGIDEWKFKDGKWGREHGKSDEKLEPDYQWQKISAWGDSAKKLQANKVVSEHPWKFSSFLHPSLEKNQRCVKQADGLFLENSVQIPEDICLIYLSTYPLENGWYRFGGENHIVEIDCEEITRKKVLQLLNQEIQRTFALVAPGIWGSTRYSYRYPQKDFFLNQNQTVQMLTDKPVAYRYRAKGRLGTGRYAVPAGSVYVLEQPIGKSWWNWDDDWFPSEGISLKKLGCGFCLPIDIKEI